MPSSPSIEDLVRELEQQYERITTVQHLWTADGNQLLPPRADGDHPLLYREASEWVRTHWPSLAAALEGLTPTNEW